MLTIRKEQMKVMVDFSNKAFESRLLQQIKTHYPALIAKLVSEPDGGVKLLSFIKKGIDQAASFGFEYEKDISFFFIIKLSKFQAKLEKIDDYPHYLSWVKSFLKGGNVTGSGKIALIYYRLNQQAITDQRAANICRIIDAIQ